MLPVCTGGICGLVGPASPGGKGRASKYAYPGGAILMGAAPKGVGGKADSAWHVKGGMSKSGTGVATDIAATRVYKQIGVKGLILVPERVVWVGPRSIAVCAKSSLGYIDSGRTKIATYISPISTCADHSARGIM